jgi:hypothetical protein
MNKIFTCLAVACLLWGINRSDVKAQDADYNKVAKERADKIVAGLNLKKNKAATTSQLIAGQYISLNQLHTNRDAQLKTAAGDTAKINLIRKNTDNAVAKLHTAYVSKLNNTLTPVQVEAVKDGMTYNTVPLTYANYLLMLPYLTSEQQTTIKANLIEAREHALDGGTSKEKQQWFGKYKGRIANYLASQGYNLKKEGDDWARRRDTSSKDIAIKQSNAVMKGLKIDTADKRTYESVRNLVAFQYQKIAELNTIRTQKLKKLADSTGLSKEAKDKADNETWLVLKADLEKQKTAFLKKLATWINDTQVEQVKNGMTNNKLQQEYDHFLALLPNLKADQKKKVYDYLVEARDNAMNTQTSREVNQWFAKYRGRANNYLAAQGYNLRQATEELERKTGKPQ